jgi:hypothetical protein
VAIGVLVAAYPPDLVDAAIDACEARELRRRALPAQLVAYYTMAMTLCFDLGYGEVWNTLLAGLSLSPASQPRQDARMRPSAAAISKARARLGWRPLAELLSMAMAQNGREPAPRAYWRNLRKLTISGLAMKVPASRANGAAFGSEREGGLPQVGMVALTETGSRALAGVHVGPAGEGEQAMARRLWPLLRPGDVVVADRGFLSYANLDAVVRAGAHAIFRADDDEDLPVLEPLPDGSHLSRITDTSHDGEAAPTTVYGGEAARAAARGEGAAPTTGQGIPVRVIDYHVTRKDTPADEHVRLVTTLLDREAYPLEEFPARLAERCELASAIGELEARLHDGPGVLLRSKSPDMVRQEVYALLCVYQAVRHLVTASAENEAMDMGRITFTRTPAPAAS